MAKGQVAWNKGLKKEGSLTPNEIKLRWAKNNPEKKKSAGKKWVENNKEKCLAYNSNHKKSNREHYNKLTYMWNDKNPIKVKYAGYKSNCKKRGLILELTFDEFSELIQQECFYCGDKNGLNGVDRKDNTIGYLKENCVPCCHVCNSMKSNSTIENFINKCNQIITKFKQNGKYSI